MRSLLKYVWIAVGLLPLCAAAQQTPPAQVATTKAPPPKESVRVKFRPPANGAAAVRLTGGSRGTGDALLSLDVLAPEDAGLTTREQPSLFWYQSKPSTAKLELTVLRANQVEPLCQVIFEHASKGGIQRLNLADHSVKLAIGQEYPWVVAVITDPENRSTDLVASGVIKRVAPTTELKQQLATASADAIPGVYADAGIWYDALATLSDQIEARPEDPSLRQARADLLAQIKLKAAAESERALAQK